MLSVLFFHFGGKGTKASRFKTLSLQHDNQPTHLFHRRYAGLPA